MWSICSAYAWNTCGTGEKSMPDMPERNTPEDMDQTPRSEEALSGLEEISFDLPNFPECRSCALRIQAAMGDEDGSLTLRFDPARANAEELKERARKAKDHLDQDYCHHTFVLENMDCAGRPPAPRSGRNRHNPCSPGRRYGGSNPGPGDPWPSGPAPSAPPRWLGPDRSAG